MFISNKVRWWWFLTTIHIIKYVCTSVYCVSDSGIKQYKWGCGLREMPRGTPASLAFKDSSITHTLWTDLRVIFYIPTFWFLDENCSLPTFPFQNSVLHFQVSVEWLILSTGTFDVWDSTLTNVKTYGKESIRRYRHFCSYWHSAQSNLASSWTNGSITAHPCVRK